MADAVRRARGAARRTRHEAMLLAFEWVLHGAPAPISGQSADATGQRARVERDAAVFVARACRAPTPAEWRTLGNDAPPRITAGDTPEWAYGSWRVLAWLLGERATPPITAEDDARPGGAWNVLPSEIYAELAAVPARVG